MVHKIGHLIETLFIILTISWQPVFGIITSICASCYYIAMFEANVVNKYHEGSWKKYFRNLIDRFKNKTK